MVCRIISSVDPLDLFLESELGEATVIASFPVWSFWNIPKLVRIASSGQEKAIDIVDRMAEI